MRASVQIHGWVVASLLLSACDDAPPAELPPAQTVELPAEEAPPDPTEREGQPNIEPAAEQQLVEGISVLAPGKRSRQLLQWDVRPGSTKHLVLGLRLNKDVGKKGAPLSPQVVLAVATEITDTGPDGLVGRTFEIEDAYVSPEPRVEEAARKAAAKTLEAIVSRKGAVDTDGVGTVKMFTVAGAGDPQLQEPVGLLRQAFEHASPSFPSEAVGVGAKWQTRRRIELLGMAVWEIVDYRLDAIDGPQVEVSGRIQLEIDSERSSEPTVDGLHSIDDVAGSGTIDARVDLTTGLPIECQVQLTVAVAGKDSSGAGKSAKYGVGVNVDEDYLAAPDPRITLSGEFSQGGLVIGVAPKGTKIWFNKTRVKVSEDGDFVFGFGRDARRRALFSFAIDGDPPARHVVHVEQRTFEAERIDGLPPEWVDLPKETRRALAKSTKQVEKIRSKVSSTPHFRSGFVMPVRGKVTSTYGRQRVLNGKEKGFHWGLDLAAPSGKKVRAPAPGTVVFAETGVPLSGTLLILDHGHGLTSSFLHLKSIKVAVGQTVRRGQVVATVGNSGRSTGPHLDWRMNLLNKRIDPQLVVDAGR